ncbi:cytosine permease [Aquibacillus albus]|uniref:Cytosine permease n=1 Tax=Aquibacillus albus TaxID=1168171 RepID=A0ABS2N5Q7_9BACI|nr:cytosine permease [Aquibacillus albus]MBM7573448.1 cytosine permease [Aquibacillus albus]
METKKIDRALEDYGVSPVPQEKTKNYLSMALIWSGVGISLGLLLTGGTLGVGLTFKQTLIAGFAGGFVLAIITALVGIIGAKTNLSTAMISRFAFGELAIIGIALIQAFGSYGWFGVQLGLFGNTASVAWEQTTGISGNAMLFIVLGGICMIATATFGYKALDVLSKGAVPLLLILMIASVWRILQNNNVSDIFSLQGSGDPLTLGQGISIVISSFVVGAVVAPDVSRYAKSEKDTIIAALMAFFIVTPLIVLVGTVMAQVTGTWDLVDIMIGLGWGTFALLVLMFAQWTSNDNNLYSSALGFAVVFKKLKKWQLTVISGVLGIILSLFGIYDNFIPFLSVLGILIPPMGGVIIVDYYLFNKSDYSIQKLANIPRIRLTSISCWILGSVVALLTTNGVFSLTTISSLDGILVAGLSQFIVLKIAQKSDSNVSSDTIAS